MNRSDLYGCSSYWRNNNVQQTHRSFSFKKYFLIVPIFGITVLSPGTIDVSSALQNEAVIICQQRESLEERLDRLFNGDISKHKLMPYIKDKVEKLMGSELEKKDLETTLSNLSAYEDYIIQASKEKGLDINFVKAYFAMESMGDQEAESEKGAKGLGGMMVSAAKEVNLRVDDHVDERVSPKSIFGSVSYMKEKCIDRFNDYVLGMIAYNVGPTWTSENTTHILKSYDIMKNKRIPLESRWYVLHVLAKTLIFSNPDVYNLQVQKKELVSRMIRSEEVIKRDITIKRLANIHKVKVSDLKRVNPAIKADLVPKGTTINIPHYL